MEVTKPVRNSPALLAAFGEATMLVTATRREELPVWILEKPRLRSKAERLAACPGTPFRRSWGETMAEENPGQGQRPREIQRKNGYFVERSP